MAQPEHPERVEVPSIPDHTMVRCVGRGSYGEVWLAQSVMGTYRGIKIVHRTRFDDERPFEREFEGIQKFEPVSRTHPGLVSVLHVGRNRVGNYFYYIMEIADDVATAQRIDPATYNPKTLSTELKERGRLPPKECLRLGLALISALGHLHRHGLVHRDIKPSNVIFVNGNPKFADIGLVTNISEAATYVGTVGYIPPEGPGTARADLFGLGKVLYELASGRRQQEFPDFPNRIDEVEERPLLTALEELILKACAENSHLRFQSAEEMQEALASLLEERGPTRTDARVPDSSDASTMVNAASGESKERRASAGYLETPESDSVPGRPDAQTRKARVAILYKANAHPDRALLEFLIPELSRHGWEVFVDKQMAIGVEWAREIENKIRNSDAAIVLLSAASILSEMVAYEVELAHQGSQATGKPVLLPVRLGVMDPLPSSLAGILDPLQYFFWNGPDDSSRLVSELIRAVDAAPGAMAPKGRVKLEAVGGAVPLDSKFYIERPSDHEFRAAMARRDSIVLLKGARQMGKTSLLARGLQQARQAGAKVVLTDFQKLNLSHLASIESFFLTLGEFFADQLDLGTPPEEVWDKRRSPNTNFERYLRREVLGKMNSHFVWGLDEVDRLFACDFGSEVFGLFRSWHNERALDPSGPWSRMTMAIAYATEAHLFITDVNQSPFNVGSRLTLDDFNLEQVAELNRRYGSPLKTDAELQRFHLLLGGQPYLVRRGLNEMASGNLTFSDFIAHADRDEGIFGDHLRRILVLLAKDQELSDVVRGILRRQPCPNSTSFYRLRSAGVMRGDSPQQVQPRCEIYATYLRRHLG